MTEAALGTRVPDTKVTNTGAEAHIVIARRHPDAETGIQRVILDFAGITIALALGQPGARPHVSTRRMPRRQRKTTRTLVSGGASRS